MSRALCAWRRSLSLSLLRHERNPGDLAGCHPEDDNNVSELDLEDTEIAEHGGNTSATNHEDDDSLAEDEPSCKRAHIEDLHDFNKSISRQHTHSPPVTSHTHKGKNASRG